MMNTTAIKALNLVLLFYEAPWTEENQRKWKETTGSDDATTKSMCDHVRTVIDDLQTSDELVPSGIGDAPGEDSAKLVSSVMHQEDKLKRSLDAFVADVVEILEAIPKIKDRNDEARNVCNEILDRLDIHPFGASVCALCGG